MNNSERLKRLKKTTADLASARIAHETAVAAREAARNTCAACLACTALVSHDVANAPCAELAACPARDVCAAYFAASTAYDEAYIAAHDAAYAAQHDGP